MNRMAEKLLLSLCALAVWGAAQAEPPGKIIHTERSLYREVLVYESSGERCMCFTRECRIGRQSCMDIKDSNRLAIGYTRMMLGALYVQPDPKRVLIVGLGGGSLPKALLQLLPNARIDVVEIDPAVTRVAREYFALPSSERLDIAELDGRVLVKRAQRRGAQYDLILLDAFDHEYIPEHLLTREFLAETKSLLAADGVLAANTFSMSRLYDHESATYQAVFGTFYNLKSGNRVIIAQSPSIPVLDAVKRNAARWEAPFTRLGAASADILKLFSTQRDWNANARLLTDQYSPANLLNRAP